MKDTLRMPPWTVNDHGEPRRVGVELELIGMTVDDIVDLLCNYFVLTCEEDGRYRRILRGDPAGAWIVELDFKWLQQLGREPHRDDELLGEIRSSAEALLEKLSEHVVPREIVTPPLPLRRLQEVEKLIGMLRAAGARGTADRVRYAFGMQFNVEIPSTDPFVLTSLLQAFVCLYDWLFMRADVDLTRRITSYVDPFPIEYVRRIVAPYYTPDLDNLIDDYLEFNPTRNRALDLLPLFLHLDEQRVRARTDDPLIKARPAFHYRLPDCNIHLPGWGLATSWNDWITVERLAADPQRLSACCTAYSGYLEQPWQRWLGKWTQEVQECWIDNGDDQRSQTPSR